MTDWLLQPSIILHRFVRALTDWREDSDTLLYSIVVRTILNERIHQKAHRRFNLPRAARRLFAYRERQRADVLHGMVDNAFAQPAATRAELFLQNAHVLND